MKQKSLKLNFIMNAILTMSSFIFPLITFPYISRVLQPAGNGKVNFMLSVITYFNMFAQLGIPTYGIRACAMVRDDRVQLTRTVHELLSINIVTTILTYIVLIFAIIFVPRLHQDKTLAIIMSFTIILTTIGIEWLYKALEQYTYITVRSIIFKIISIVAMFMLVHAKSDYMIYGAITTFASSGSFILNLINAHKYIGFKPVGSYNIKRHMKPVMIFFAMSIATTIYTNLDSVMLGFMKTDADVGYYTAAVKIKTILVSLVTSLGTVLLPRASYYIEKGEIDEFTKLSRKAMNFVILSALPLMIYFMIFAKNGIFFLSGSAYAGSIAPMQIIMPTLLFIGISNLTGIQILVPLKKENIVLISTIIGAIVDLIINTLLIPQMASSGAAIGTLAAEFFVTLYQYLVVRHSVHNLFQNVSIWKIALANGLAIVASFKIASLNLGNFIILVISAILYFGVYLLVLLFTKESLTISIVDQLIRKLRKS